MKAVITVVGKDTVGVIAKVSAVCAELNINVEDVTQSIMQDMFCMIMLVNLSRCTQDMDAVRARFAAIADEMGMPVEKVREILKIAQEPVSLETPIGEEEDSHLGDFIPDEGASEPSEAASFTLLKEQLVDVLSTLTPREEKVLKLRFGIEDGRTRTLEEVGKEFNVTRERIRQIEAKALRKLRHPSRSKKLKDFLN